MNQTNNIEGGLIMAGKRIGMCLLLVLGVVGQGFCEFSYKVDLVANKLYYNTYTPNAYMVMGDNKTTEYVMAMLMCNQLHRPLSNGELLKVSASLQVEGIWYPTFAAAIHSGTSLDGSRGVGTALDVTFYRASQRDWMKLGIKVGADSRTETIVDLTPQLYTPAEQSIVEYFVAGILKVFHQTPWYGAENNGSDINDYLEWNIGKITSDPVTKKLQDYSFENHF